MAHTASDGRQFTNLPPMKAHQRSLDAKGGKKNPLQMPGTGGEMGGGGEDPEQVVAEHGPAREVHVTHEHEAGKHHVHSMHEDGHEHHSDHASAEEAHDHAKTLGTEGGDDGGEDEMGGFDDAEYE